MNRKDRKWLEHVRLCTDSFSGMYPGVRFDDLPKRCVRRFRAAGYISSHIPWNPAHKERWVITQTGREALEDG